MCDTKIISIGGNPVRGHKDGTKVNWSHHGDNPLLRPTGIQIATKSYATLPAMASTNNKTVHSSNLLYSISRAASIDSDLKNITHHATSSEMGGGEGKN